MHRCSIFGLTGVNSYSVCADIAIETGFCENHDVAIHNPFVGGDLQPQLIRFVRQRSNIAEEKVW